MEHDASLNLSRAPCPAVVIRGDRGPDLAWDDVAAGLLQCEQSAPSVSKVWSPTPASALLWDDLDALTERHRHELAEMFDLHQRMASSLRLLALAARRDVAAGDASLCVGARLGDRAVVDEKPPPMASPPPARPPTVQSAEWEAPASLQEEGGDPLKEIELQALQKQGEDNPSESGGPQKPSRPPLTTDAPSMRSSLEQVLTWFPDNPFVLAFKPWILWCLNATEPTRSGRLFSIISSPPFETFSLGVIVVNALFSAYVADWEIKNIGSDLTLDMRVLELCFLSFYVFELTAKLTVHGLYFFWNHEWGFNNFDLILVSLSVVEQLVTLISDGTGGNFSFMRIIRLLKLTKVGRLFRVLKFFRELRLMLYAIKNSFVSLFWALIMLVFIMYMFGLVILQGMVGLLADDTSQETHDRVLSLFDSLYGTMLGLYKSTTGGDDWGMYFTIIDEAGTVYGVLFLLYIAFFTFSVMNILTGIIVENVVALALTDQETVVIQYRLRCSGEIDEMKNLFRSLDSNGDGCMSQDEWEVGIGTQKVRAIMAAMELDISDTSSFFGQLLSVSESDRVDIDSFIDGCLKMKGQASSIDMQVLAFQNQHLQKTLNDLLQKVSTCPPGWDPLLVPSPHP